MADTVAMRGIGQNSKRDENGTLWGDHRCTPEPIWRMALEAIARTSFDLDPATNPHSTVPAMARRMGPDVDGRCGLTEPWGPGPDVWLNFPFSRPAPWIDKAIEEASWCHSITVLGPGDTSVKWWHRITRACAAWCALPKRYHFPLPGRPKGSPPAPVHLWYFGENRHRWFSVVRGHGCIAYPGAV